MADHQTNEGKSPQFHVHSTPMVIRENRYIRSSNIPHDGNVLAPELRQVLLQAHIQESSVADQDIPKRSKAIPVVNIETGSHHWMVPPPPERIYYLEPAEDILHEEKVYRFLFLVFTILLMILTLVQVFFWVVFIDHWPSDFLVTVVESKSYYFGHYLREITFILAVHPLVHAVLAITAVFCFRNNFLRIFSLRSTLFCYIVAFVLAITIMVIGGTSGKDIDEVFKEGIDIYDLYNWTTIDKDKREKAMYYREALNTLQANLKCCGIRNGIEDWISQRRSEEIKIPKACCTAYSIAIELNQTVKHMYYDKDLEFCTRFPANTNTWNIGCLDLFLNFFTQISTGFLAMQIFNIIFVVATSYIGMQYHTCRIQELEEDYTYPTTQYIIDCFCLNKCIKVKKPLSDEEMVELKETHQWKKNQVRPSMHEDEKTFETRHKHHREMQDRREDTDEVTLIPHSDVVHQRKSRIERQSVYSFVRPGLAADAPRLSQLNYDYDADILGQAQLVRRGSSDMKGDKNT